MPQSPAHHNKHPGSPINVFVELLGFRGFGFCFLLNRWGSAGLGFRFFFELLVCKSKHLVLQREGESGLRASIRDAIGMLANTVGDHSQMSYSLNSLEGVYIGGYIGDYNRRYSGGV